MRFEVQGVRESNVRQSEPVVDAPQFRNAFARQDSLLSTPIERGNPVPSCPGQRRPRPKLLGYSPRFRWVLSGTPFDLEAAEYLPARRRPDPGTEYRPSPHAGDGRTEERLRSRAREPLKDVRRAADGVKGCPRGEARRDPIVVRRQVVLGWRVVGHRDSGGRSRKLSRPGHHRRSEDRSSAVRRRRRRLVQDESVERPASPATS